MNGNGLRLLEICTELGLFISSTQFKHKGDHVTTWMHPRSKQWHLIDYVIVRRRDMSDVHNVASLRGADCWSDHSLVRGKFCFSIHPKCRRSNTLTLPRQLDVSKLKNSDDRAAFQQTISTINNTSSWEDLCDKILEVSKDTLGFKKANHRDWFDENDNEISQILSQKNDLRQALLQTNLDPEKRNELEAELKKVKAEAQSYVRGMKDRWWSALAEDMQSAADRNDSKQLYSLMKQAYGPKVAKIVPLRSSDGSKLFSTMEDISGRWKEHFNELLNRDSNVDSETLANIPQRPIVNEMNYIPSLAETKSGIGKLNLGKAPGKDGLPAEIFVYGASI